MPDPFATALGVLLKAPGSVAGDYLPKAGGSFPIRAIRQSPDEEVNLKIGSAIVGTNELIIAIADIPARPVKDDRFILTDGTTLSVTAAAKMDAEGISWKVQLK